MVPMCFFFLVETYLCSMTCFGQQVISRDRDQRPAFGLDFQDQRVSICFDEKKEWLFKTYSPLLSLFKTYRQKPCR